MGMAAGGSGGFASEINVTPMVDIMLVLLIIFMVVTPFLQQGITVNIPRDSVNPDVDQNIIKESSIVISIPNDNEYYLGKQKVTIDMSADPANDPNKDFRDKVEKMLEPLKNEPERQIVYIKSGTGVSYGTVVNVINEVRKLGVDKIGLVADKKKGKGAAAPTAPAAAS
jgi:biopolymer transport protein TolR